MTITMLSALGKLFALRKTVVNYIAEFKSMYFYRFFQAVQLRKFWIGRRAFVLGLGLAWAGKALAQARYATFAPRQGKLRTLGEGDQVLLHPRDQVVLDIDQGFVQALSNSQIDLPILRSIGGGNQTVIRVSTGKVLAQFRKLTNVNSVLKIVNYSSKLALMSIGTRYVVWVNEQDSLIAGVDEGKVSATSGGEMVDFIGGQGAILKEGQAPVIFQVDYRLEVVGFKVETYMGRKNIVSGTVALGNSVEVDDGVVVMEGRSFRAVTLRDYVRVLNASGNERRVYFSGGVRPFFGH